MPCTFRVGYFVMLYLYVRKNYIVSMVCVACIAPVQCNGAPPQRNGCRDSTVRLSPTCLAGPVVTPLTLLTAADSAVHSTTDSISEPNVLNSDDHYLTTIKIIL